MRLSSGFTLVELLVSIAIVGILSSLAVINFNEYQERANDSKSISLGHDIQVAAEAFMPEMAYYNGYPAEDHTYYMTSGTIIDTFPEIKALIPMLNQASPEWYILIDVANFSVQYWQFMIYNCKGASLFYYLHLDRPLPGYSATDGVVRYDVDDVGGRESYCS